MNIEAFKALVNGHVVGADEQSSLFWSVNLSLDSYRQRWWLHGGGDLYPCGCAPTMGYGAPHHRIDLIEPRNEYLGAFVPTPGVGGAAQNIVNRGLVDYPEPSFSDSIFPAGDRLQGQLYESLNAYWLEGVP